MSPTGAPFRIELVFDGTREHVLLNGKVVAPVGPGTGTRTSSGRAGAGTASRSTGPRPDADFAWLVFGLSAALWASCHEGREVRIDTEAELQETMQRYPESVARQARYPALRWYEQVEHGGIVEAPPFCRDSLL